jgi:hypothetical protein
MLSTTGILAQLPVVTLLTGGLKLVTHKATPRVHAGELPMATTSKKRQRNMTARRHRMATDTEIRRVACGAGLAIKRRLAAVSDLTEAQRVVRAWPHRAVAARTRIDLGINKAPMTGAAQAIRRTRLFLVQTRKSGMMHELLRDRMRRLWPHIRAHFGVTDVAFFGQIRLPYPTGIVVTRGALLHSRNRVVRPKAIALQHSAMTLDTINRGPIPALHVTTVRKRHDVAIR